MLIIQDKNQSSVQYVEIQTYIEKYFRKKMRIQTT
jgi:hypothetical protein